MIMSIVFYLMKNYCCRSQKFLVIATLLMAGGWQATAQESPPTLESATLEQVVAYALKHQPAVRQAEIDQDITDKAIKGKLADWYPQLNFTFIYQHFIDLQSSVIGGNVIRFGVNNTSSAQFGATQSLFNRDLLLATSTASLVRTQSGLNTSKRRIDVAVSVSKAFYDALATMQQVEVSRETISRLEKSLKDAETRYQTGISDKTDYKRAMILLGNARASLTSNTELLKFKLQLLKNLMGYPAEAELALAYDAGQMEEEIALDTTFQLNYTAHIDYRILQSQRSLQQANVKYARWGYLPSVGLFGNYNLNYQHNNFGELYAVNYPYSFVGVTASLPIAQGGKRVVRMRQEQLAADRLDAGLEAVENALDAEYSRALAAYKSNLAAYLAQKENVELAAEVYDVIRLQYQNGVKTYLDVTVAETDLRTTQISYFNALYQVLSSKLDVLQALGQITY